MSENNQNDVRTSEATSANIQNEAVSAENLEVTKKPEIEEKAKREYTAIERVAWIIASEIAKLAHPKAEKEVRETLNQILLVLFSINKLGEYEQGVRAKDGVFYRFEEYIIPSTFQAFVTGAKVVVADVGTAVDFLDRSKYNHQVEILSPGEMAAKFKWLGSKIRKPVTLVSLSRPKVMLLAEATPFAVRGGRVTDRAQKSIVYLTTKFDSEQNVDIEEWARFKALELFE